MTTRLQVAYCLTSTGDDIYEAMTRVSLATLRKHNSKASIQVFCDELSYLNLKSCNSRLFKEADNVVGIATPAGEAAFRNRFIKTQLRLLLNGPFLYLDSDTVIRRSLADISRTTADIAAAPNHSADCISDQIWLEDYKNLDMMGWQARAPYFNGGVVWYADSSKARSLAERWHASWLENIRVTGRFRDQPALNHSLNTTPDLQLHCLDHCWNAQVKTPQGLAYAVDAAIWHIYSSYDIADGDLFSLCCTRLKHQRSLRPNSRLLKKLLTADTPFVAPEDQFTWKHRLALLLETSIPFSKRSS
jgi:lipopolysaccharide biosynthesis glycosyltransferase